MEEPTVSVNQVTETARRFAHRLLLIGENRFELLTVEAQEELQQLLQSFLLALAAAVVGLLGAMTLTAALVILLWPFAPFVLLGMTGLYGGAGVFLYRKLLRRLREGRLFSASLDQLRKDRRSLEKALP